MRHNRHASEFHVIKAASCTLFIATSRLYNTHVTDSRWEIFRSWPDSKVQGRRLSECDSSQHHRNCHDMTMQKGKFVLDKVLAETEFIAKDHNRDVGLDSFTRMTHPKTTANSALPLVVRFRVMNVRTRCSAVSIACLCMLSRRSAGRNACVRPRCNAASRIRCLIVACT